MPAPRVDDRVLLNVAALDRGLGTGGYALVVAVLGPDGSVVAQPPQPAGHLVKARYLPLQAMVAGADEQGSPHHDLLADADSLDGLPVVVADLHSALAPTLLALAHDRPGTRVVYVMSDQGALPIAFSRTVAQLRDAGLLAGHRDRGPVVRRRPRGRHRPLRAARRPPRARRGGRRRHAGAGQPRHRHPLGLLRGRRRRGRQRRRRAGRSPRGQPADLRRRRPAAAPRRLAPQPHRVRAGRPQPGRPGRPRPRRGRPAARRRRSRRARRDGPRRRRRRRHG